MASFNMGNNYSIMFIPNWEVTMEDIHDADKVGGFLEWASGEWYDWHDLNKEDLKYALMWIDGKYKQIDFYINKFLNPSFCKMIDLKENELKELGLC